MKCPYCNKLVSIPTHVFMNVESYGSKIVHFPCDKCNKVISVAGQRTVSWGISHKTDKESDW